jgi:hypothetical protein
MTTRSALWRLTALTAAFALTATTSGGVKDAYAYDCVMICQPEHLGGCPDDHYKFADIGEGSYWNYNWRYDPGCFYYGPGWPPCPAYECMGFAAFEAIAGWVASNNIGAIKTELATNPKVSYNAQRRAIQITGCDGSLSAHIPLPEAIASVL